MHQPCLNCFLSEAAGRNGISTIWETDNEQNKRSEEKQKSRPFPCIEEGFALVLLSCEKNGGRIFPRSPPRQVESLPSSLRSVAAALRPSSSRVRQKGRERATKGGKVRRETTAGRYDETTTSTVGVAASGDEADQYFCTQAPSGSGPWYRGALAPPGSDILNSYLCYCQNLYICLSMNKFEGSWERLCDLSKQTLLREITKWSFRGFSIKHWQVHVSIYINFSRIVT